jgi:lipopolysaccharide transport system ATP-binding protein
MSDTIISVENLGKKYRLNHQTDRPRYTALRDVVANKVKGLFQNQNTPNGKSFEDFWALKDVSFEVKRGEVVGIIGRNGAGKSTLLKVLSRITEPTIGEVRLKGRVASLLEVGTGFHPELTGRENIFLNGAILGMSRVEIKSKFDEIVSFADVEKFLDTPVKRYSSGMYVRLAFAVAAHLEPEILIVDEVLAVGDAEFQKKCLGKMQEVSRSHGRTVLFVSHNMQAVRNLCTKCLVMTGGTKTFDGNSAQALEAYQGQSGHTEIWHYETSAAKRRISSSDLARIEKVWFVSKSPRLRFGDQFQIQIQLSAVQDLESAFFDVTFFGGDNNPVGTSFSMRGVKVRRNTTLYQLTIPSLRLAPGKYYCDIAILNGNWLSSPSLHDVIVGILHFEMEFPQTEDGTVPVWHANWGPSIPEDIIVSEIQSKHE